MAERTDLEEIREPEKIEKDIARTRAEMGRTVDAIQEKLSTEHIKGEFRDKLSETRDAVWGRSREMAREAGYKFRSWGTDVWDTVRSNPVPAAMAGIGVAGVAWMIISGARKEEMYDTYEDISGRTKEKAGETIQQAREKAAEMKKQAKEKAYEAASKTKEKAYRTGSWLKDTFYANPFVLGAAIFAVGAAVGFLVPESTAERKYMGRSSAEWMGAVKEKAGRIVEKTKEAGAKATKEEVPVGQR